MQLIPLLLLACLLLATILPTVNAQGYGSGSDGPYTASFCAPTRHFVAVANVVAAGDISICAIYATHVPRPDVDLNGAATGFVSTQLVLNIAGPGIPVLSTITITPTVAAGSVGCTINSSFGQNTDSNTVSSGGWIATNIFVSAAYCSAALDVSVTISTLVSRFHFGINIYADTTVPNAVYNIGCNAPLVSQTSYASSTACNTAGLLDFGCGATGYTVATQPNTVQCTIPQIDNENRLCAASSFGATCTTPTINSAVTGTLTLSGTMNAVISGTLDVLDRLCAASPTGTTCTIASLKVLNSGNTTFNGNTTTTNTLVVPPGFWELFGPLMLAVGFVAALGVAGIWIAPGGAALGLAIFLMAFKQPYPFLTLLQATAGICLAIFCLIAVGIRVFKREKRQPRRFFDE